MKKPTGILITILITMLSGCIISKSPNTNQIEIAYGEQLTFSVDVFPSNGTYAWTLDERTLSNTGSSYTYTAQSGEHDLKVTVTHANGIDTQTWHIITNRPPVAHAGPDQTVAEGIIVTLDASNSTDPDGDIVSYLWTLTSIPSGSSAVLSDPTSVNPTFTPDVPGNYIAQLIVSDGRFSSEPSTVLIEALETIDLIINGSFESDLFGWTTSFSFPVGIGGSCCCRSVTAPGTDATTGLPGFDATDGTKIALGSVAQTSGGDAFITCVLYQDVAIPAGASTATFTYDIGAKGGVDGGFNTSARVGIYPTTAVPKINTPTLVGPATIYAVGIPDLVLHISSSTVNFDISSVAGTTVRFAIINAANNYGTEVIGIDNVKLWVMVAY